MVLEDDRSRFGKDAVPFLVRIGDGEWRPDRGKCSHGIAYLNGQRTVVRNLKDELKTGTFHGMLKQLGIDESDLYD